MNKPPVSRMTADELIVLATAFTASAPCQRCAPLVCKGWESVPGGFDRSALHCVGTLRDVNLDEPTVAEHHPAGTHGWSADAPIAPDWFPYNRCDVWQCVACGKPFLRYTEFGGYYTDERIRQVRAALVDGAEVGPRAQ